MSRVTLTVTLCLLLGPMLPNVFAKRTPPPKVPPVTAGGVEYRVDHQRHLDKGNMQAFIKAWDVKSGKLVWELKVYEVIYKPNLETDVQDVYISSLKLDGQGGLIVGAENKKTYRIDLGKRTVESLPAK